MTDPPYLLGLDLGTTTSRCAIFDLTGRQVTVAYDETTVHYPRALWAEVDPEDWWQGTVKVIRATLQASGVPAQQIGAVGLSGLMHAPVLLDGDGRPVAPAMLWMAQRCAAQCQALNRDCADVGLPKEMRFSTTSTAPKLRWLADERPELLARKASRAIPALLVRPEDALQSLRTAMLLGSVVPELRSRAEKLAGDLTELVALRKTIVLNSDCLFVPQRPVHKRQYMQPGRQMQCGWCVSIVLAVHKDARAGRWRRRDPTQSPRAW